MTWISGPCGPDDGVDGIPVEDEEEQLEYEQPRMVWGQATHYAGIVDRDNPGHFTKTPERPQ